MHCLERAHNKNIFEAKVLVRAVLDKKEHDSFVVGYINLMEKKVLKTEKM